MNVAHDLIVDPAVDPASASGPARHLATWYTQGHSDGLGDRLLMFDNTSAPSWEILRFSTAIAHVPAFEDALRERVEALRAFRHPAFSVVRAIEELGREDGLTVASTYSTGVRLADAFKKPRSTAFTLRLMRQLTAAIAALHRYAPDMAHGALTADRILILPEGRLMVREHMVGSALDALGLSPARLWAHFGVVAHCTEDAVIALDQRSDVVQLGIIALSLMTGRRIGPDEFPTDVDALLDAAAGNGAQPPERFQPLRRWIERALQVSADRFESACDANDALADLADETGWPDDLVFPGFSTARATTEGTARRPRLISGRDLKPDAAEVTVAASRDRGREDEAPAAATGRRRVSALAIAGAALAIAAVVAGEAIYLRRVAAARSAFVAPPPSALSIESPEPGAQVWVDDQLVGATPLQLKVDSKVRSIRVLPPPVKAAPAPPAEPVVAAKNALRSAVATPKSGGFRITAPVQIYVLDGERVLGSSSDGPIVASAGAHELDFVNSAIGYRARRTVMIKPGQVTTLPIAVPNGTLNINAAPWASVWLDGAAIGDTPIGNLSVAPGLHEIVFRHPQFGERRETTMVRVDGPTRVTAKLSAEGR